MVTWRSLDGGSNGAADCQLRNPILNYRAVTEIHPRVGIQADESTHFSEWWPWPFRHHGSRTVDALIRFDAQLKRHAEGRHHGLDNSTMIEFGECGARTEARCQAMEDPVLTAAEARELLDCIDVGTIRGLRDRAFIGVMLFCFAPVGAVVAMNGDDYFRQKNRRWFRLHETGGKRHDLPAHPLAPAYMDAYLRAARIGDACIGARLWKSSSGMPELRYSPRPPAAIPSGNTHHGVPHERRHDRREPAILPPSCESIQP